MLSPLRALGVAAAVALGAGCSGKLPSPAAASKCGDQCASLNCPPGSQCTLDERCTPRCEQEFIPPH